MTATSNIWGDYTLLNYPGAYLNNMPGDILFVTPRYVPGSYTLDIAPLGVWYMGSYWTIFNEYRSSMPLNQTFNVQAFVFGGFQAEEPLRSLSGRTGWCDPLFLGEICRVRERRETSLMRLFNNQDRSCSVTPPRSEGSRSLGTEMLRCAQHDTTDFGRYNSLSAMGAIHRPLQRAGVFC